MNHTLVSEPTTTGNDNERPVKLCLHGHFYQPPREDPFSGLIPTEPGASPYLNFNERICAECYSPLAQSGTFGLMSFDMGPTLAAWLERAHPDIYGRIIEADRQHVRRYGVGNALAQPFNHTILPLAKRRDKITQVRWGLHDFRQRYGRDAHGMWLAEAAVDRETLDILAQHGITYTILASWQIAHAVDSTEPYFISLEDGRSIAVFVYNDWSGAVSYDDSQTLDANDFAKAYMQSYRNPHKREQMQLIATDGELYGHHKPGREKFLSHLLKYSAAAFGFEVCTLERYLLAHPPTKEAWICEPSSWSCRWHGVSRWDSGCNCTEGDSSWKPTLRQAMNNLSERCDRLFEQYTANLLHDPWATRDDYLLLRNGWITPERFWAEHAKQPLNPKDVWQLQMLLEAQFYVQYSFTSCGWFFEDIDRIEPKNNIAFARKAISLIWQAFHIDLQHKFLQDLACARSWRTGITGADIYRQLPTLTQDWLPVV